MYTFDLGARLQQFHEATKIVKIEVPPVATYLLAVIYYILEMTT